MYNLYLQEKNITHTLLLKCMKAKKSRSIDDVHFQTSMIVPFFTGS